VADNAALATINQPDAPEDEGRKPRGVRALYVPWAAGLDVSWSVPKVRSTLLSHEEGTFWSSAKLVDAMGRDDRITATLETRVNGLMSSKRTIVPAGDWASARRVADEVKQNIDHWVPRDQVIAGQRVYHMLGQSLGQLSWEMDSRRWTPRLVVWEPQFLRYNRFERKYIATTREGEVWIDFESGQWVLLSDGDRPWMRGAVRSLSTPWLTRQWAWRDWNRYNERHGLPIVKGMIPAMSPADVKDDFETALSSMASKTTVQLPQNVDGQGASYDVDLLEAKDGAYDTFPKVIDAANVAIAVRLLGQNLTTEVQRGSLAAAAVHGQIRQDYAESDDAQEAEFEFAIMRHWARFNGIAERDLPTIRYAVEPPADTQNTASVMKTLGEGLLKLGEAGVRITADSKAEVFGELGLEIEHEGTRSRANLDELPAAPSGRSEIRLASGDAAEGDTGFVTGQLYVDDLMVDGVEALAEPMQAQLERSRRAAAGAATVAEARDAIGREQERPSPSEKQIRESLAAILGMSALGGIVAARPQEDLGGVPRRLDQYDEALAALNARARMQPDAMARLLARADEMARIRAAALRAQAAQRVLDEVKKTETDGRAIRAAANTPEIDREFGAGGNRGTLAVRMAGQEAYNMGRTDGLERDGATWLRFDAILDSVTTPVCRERNGITLPAAHQWWDYNTPPMLYNCRSAIRRVDAPSDPGAMVRMPDANPPPGFGLSDPLVWRPQPDGFDQAVYGPLLERMGPVSRA